MLRNVLVIKMNNHPYPCYVVIINRDFYQHDTGLSRYNRILNLVPLRLFYRELSSWLRYFLYEIQHLSTKCAQIPKGQFCQRTENVRKHFILGQLVSYVDCKQKGSIQYSTAFCIRDENTICEGRYILTASAALLWQYSTCAVPSVPLVLKWSVISMTHIF